MSTDSVQQLSLISKVRGGMISVIARFQRIVLDFLVFCTFDPTMDTRACVSTRRLLTICEYILCVRANVPHALRGSGPRVSARLWITRIRIRFCICFLLGSKMVTVGFTGR